MFQEREILKTTTSKSEEVVHEERLRPRDFGEFVGQENIVRNVEIMIESSKVRGVAADHMLLSGPPGLGKTSLAHLIANEVGSNLNVVSGPALEKKGDLAAILTNLKPKDVLFIDEIHRMHISIEEILYSAMEDYRLDLVIGQGPSARTMQIDVAPFTLIGATTRSGLLSRPLRDRFLASFHYDFYSEEELAKIITVNAKKLDISMTSEAASLMSQCSRGTPRISNRVLRRVRDFSIVNNKALISEAEVNDSLKLMEIDSVGLDRMDRKILQTINEFYGGGPVGIESLCATLNEDRGTLEDVYEPFLLKIGFLKRTPRGREVTQQAIDHLAQEAIFPIK